MASAVNPKDAAILEATARLAEELSEKSNARSTPPIPGNRKPYVWDTLGCFARNEGGLVIKYVRGDKVLLTPYEAYHCRGSIKTLGGLLIPAALFDGKKHPRIEEPRLTTPQERAEAEARRAAADRQLAAAQSADDESAATSADKAAADADDDAEAERIAEEARRARANRSREING